MQPDPDAATADEMRLYLGTPWVARLLAEARASERQRIRQWMLDAVGDCPHPKCCLPLFVADVLDGGE